LLVCILSVAFDMCMQEITQGIEYTSISVLENLCFTE